MASIAMISEQNIVVATPYVLPVAITGSPIEVAVYGDFDEFHYDYTFANGILRIKGTPQRLLKGQHFEIEAEFPGNIVLTRDVAFNVVAAAPIIRHPGTLRFFRNFNYNDFPISIEIANNPKKVRVHGLQVGLGHKKTKKGADIIGRIPATAEAEFTRAADDTTVSIFASNTGGPHTLSGIPMEIGGDAVAPTISRISDLNISQGGSVNINFTVAGTQPMLVEANGLPKGVKLTMNSETSYTISGTAREHGNHNVRVITKNGVSEVEEPFAINVSQSFLWVASGTSIYKIDPVTFRLASGTNTIDLSGENLRTSNPIIDLAFGGGDLYALVFRPDNYGQVLRINTTSGAVTQRLSLGRYQYGNRGAAYGFAYEVQDGDDAAWLLQSSGRIYKSQPVGTQLNSYLRSWLPTRPTRALPNHCRGMDYYDDALWVLNFNTYEVYKVTDDLSPGRNNHEDGTLVSTTRLNDTDGNRLHALYGMAIGGGFLWTIRHNGILYKHNISDLSYDSETDISPTGATAPRAIAYQA